MHLVYRAREGDTTPMTLPPGMVPPSKRKGGVAGLAGAVPVLPGVPGVVLQGGRSTPTIGK